jgi:hypothetical protein
MLNVVSYKWGEKYSPEYWNVLRASVKRNLNIPHRFIVICDNDVGLDKKIETIPMDMGKDFFDFWTKMTIFRPRPFGIDGRILLLDVDTVITGNLDAIIAFDDDFYTYPNWWSKDIAFGVTLMNAGSRRILWDLFVADPQKIMNQYTSDEAFITGVFPKEKYFPKPWIRSYKAHCSTTDGRAGGVPEGCKFICFHGKPDPHQVITGRSGQYGPDTWIADYWRI